MPLLLELDVAHLAAVRFAASPLGETVKAVQLLARSDPPTVNQPWLAWARRELERAPLRVGRLWPLLVTGKDYYPEFLIPAPEVQWPAFEDELARLRAAAHAAVRSSLLRVFDDGTWPESAIAVFSRPADGLAEIADELALCHSRLIAPHWERMRAVLEADIAYRGGRLASGGAAGLFGDLHPDLRWSAGVITLGDSGPAIRSTMGADGLVLMASVFNWPVVSGSKATSTQSTITYPARGAATVWHALSPQTDEPGPVAALLGETRARLLLTLRSPASTAVLARQLGVTPGAVSQHLGVLHRGGLVTRQRSGRSVLYQTSELGLALLQADV
jgi:DNA-binding transcriptional ArsR family regulator